METTTLKNKIWLGLAFGLVVGTVFRRLSLKYFSVWIAPTALVGTAWLILAAGVALPYVWHRLEKKQRTSGLKAWLEHAICYALAIDLSMFGWHKVEGLQMIVPLGLLDEPFSEISGESLVWAFFGYSKGFMLFVAGLQIVAAWMLLFARTRLFGLLMALPLLAFVSALDFFYPMPVGMLVHGSILLFGVFYLLAQDSRRLVDFVFQPMWGLARLDIAEAGKWAFRLSIAAWPLVFSLIYAHPDKHPRLTGKYHVSGLAIDGTPTEPTGPKDSVLTAVYLDLEDEAVFHFNDYRHRYIGRYRLDDRTDSIHIRWRYPADTLAGFAGTLRQVADAVELKGEMGGEELRMTLRKVAK